MKTIITKIFARQILDSRGNPTIEVDVKTNNGFGRAKIPSGASTGKYEAVELRDNLDAYNGKSVLNAVNNVNNILAKKITGMNAEEQEQIDNLMIELDGTANKAKLGANAILGVSLACARAASDSINVPLHRYLAEKYAGNNSKYILPAPMMNVMNAGKHAGGKLQMQEFMLMPIGQDSFKEALQTGVECYHKLKEKIKSKYGISAINVGDEGGYAPPFAQPEEPLDLLVEIIEEAGGGEDNVKIALDPAATEFYNPNTRTYSVGEKQYSTEELIDYYIDLIKTYPIISLEDGLEENDFNGFAELTEKTNIQIVGDDLFVTNVERLKKGIDKKSTNALLLKLNQIGTLTESINALKLARKNNYKIVVSHRSGETCDSFISDFVVGLGTGQIKTGAPARSERTEKYNQLLRIEEYEEENCIFENPFK